MPFFVKCEMPISFPLNCEWTNLFSVKSDLDLYHPHLGKWADFSKCVITDLWEAIVTWVKLTDCVACEQAYLSG